MQYLHNGLILTTFVGKIIIITDEWNADKKCFEKKFGVWT